MAGVALIEILITVLVLAIGLLGLAGLQTRTLRFTQTSVQHTQALLLSNEMADRMRSNPAGVTTGAYKTGATGDDCLGNPCTPAQLAGYDIAQWNESLRDGRRLVNGSGVICIDSTPDDGTPGADGCDNSGTVYAIKLWWNEADRAQDTTRYGRFTTSLSQ
jgi:type IV pilus assembly protein PilV